MMIMALPVEEIKNLEQVLKLFSKLGGVIVLEFDSAGLITRCNEEFLKLTVPQEPIGKSIGEFVEKGFSEESQHRGIFKTFIKANNLKFPVTGFFSNFYDSNIFAGQRIRLSDNDIFEQMTAINQDLAVATRMLEKKNQQLKEANRKIHEIAITDGLTRLYNRRYFFEVFNKMFSLSKRKKHALSVVMADIDYFKKINDDKGHQVGDKTLTLLGKVLKKNCRKEDIPARYGGEEFVISLMDVTLKDAVIFSNRLRTEFSSGTENHLGFKTTLSLGAAQLGYESDPESLIAVADKKLYQAKDSGRDKVCY